MYFLIIIVTRRAKQPLKQPLQVCVNAYRTQLDHINFWFAFHRKYKLGTPTRPQVMHAALPRHMNLMARTTFRRLPASFCSTCVWDKFPLAMHTHKSALTDSSGGVEARQNNLGQRLLRVLRVLMCFGRLFNDVCDLHRSRLTNVI